MADTRVRIARLMEGPAVEMHRFSPFRPAGGYVMVATLAGQSRFCLLAENLGHSGTHPTTRIYEVFLRPAGGGLPESGGHFTPMPGGFANVGGALPHGDWVHEPEIDVFVIPLVGPGQEAPVILQGRLQRVPFPLPRPVFPAAESEAAAPASVSPPPQAPPTAPMVAAVTTLDPLHADLYGLNSPDLNPLPASGLPWDALVGWPVSSKVNSAVPIAARTDEGSLDVDQANAMEEAPVLVMAGAQPETADLPAPAPTAAESATDTSPAEEPALAADPPPAPPESQAAADATLTGGTTHSLTVSVVLQASDTRATRARGSVVLDYVSGDVLVTVRGLGHPSALVGGGNQRLALYRVWLHSEKTGLHFHLGACQRLSADTYRLETLSKVKLSQFEQVLISAEAEGSTPSRNGPSGPVLLAGTYRS